MIIHSEINSGGENSQLIKESLFTVAKIETFAKNK